MLTRCPQCFAWFRVRAEQLSVANGQVTCGRCEHVFNALASLIEEGATPPLPPKVEDVQVLAEVQAIVETQARATSSRFVAVTATSTIAPPRARGALPVITSTSAQHITLAEGPIALVNDEPSDVFKPPVFAREAALNDELPMVDAHAAEIDPPPAEQPADSLDLGPMSTQLDELDISDFDFSAVDNELDQTQASDADDEVLQVSIAVDEESDEHDYTGPRPEPNVPAVLLDDLAALKSAPRPSAWRGVAWTLFGLLLAALAALQVAFIERQALLTQVPDAAPLIDSLCARLPCLERREAATSVRLLARDVREHPSYRDALLVNATIVNEAKTPSPYPVIDLRLRDAAGNVLSARQFQPSEYLDQSIAIAAGMPSARPVYIVLELAGNASNAVSFEFTFL